MALLSCVCVRRSLVLAFLLAALLPPAFGRVASVRPLVAQARPVQAQAQAPTDSALEYQVKAAYLLNFTRYVEWPSNVWQAPAAPLVLCVVGVNPFGVMLDATVRGRKSQGRSIEVRRVTAKADVKGCHLVFIGRAEARRQPDILKEISGPGILTVGEGEPFAEAGGVIAFVIEDQSVRFAVNLDAAEQAKLRMSSHMLALASRLYGDPKSAGEP